MKIVTSIALALMLILGYPSAQAEGWRLAKSDFGIDIEYRYPTDSPWRVFRGKVEVAAKPDRVVRFLQDLDALPTWHYRTKSAEVIQMEGLTSALLHIVTKSTWPVKKRDVVCRVMLTLSPDSDTIHITMDSVDNALPPVVGTIRMNKLKAKWTIEPAGDSRSRISYETYVEPGGKLPRWLFNSLAMDIPLFSLRKLRRIFEE